MHETCFRDRGIDWLCMKCVSEIGVLIWDPLFVGSLFSPVIPLSSWYDLVSFINPPILGWFLHPHLFLFYLPCLLSTMSSTSSSYVHIGMDNLERPLNHSPSPRAQVRGFDWSSFVVD